MARNTFPRTRRWSPASFRFVDRVSRVSRCSITRGTIPLAGPPDRDRRCRDPRGGRRRPGPAAAKAFAESAVRSPLGAAWKIETGPKVVVEDFPSADPGRVTEEKVRT